MMLTAIQHMDSSAYASPSSASPWQQLLPAERSHLLSYEDLAPVPAAAHQLQHRAARRVARRRPRPSRRLPTTYISADPAEFRRMVHQVTGADELLLPTPSQQQTEEPLLLPALPGRGAASVAGGTGPSLLLPTLDTSAFLLGGFKARPVAARTPPPPPCDGGSLALDNTSGSSSSHCGFPTLESWDLL